MFPLYQMVFFSPPIIVGYYLMLIFYNAILTYYDEYPFFLLPPDKFLI